MWTAGEPRLDLGRLVGGVIVHDDVDVEPFGHASVDLLEEVQELGRPVSLVAFADDEARCDVERCEQRCRAVPHVIVRPAFGDARHHRQDRLLPIERLDLAFLVDAKDKRPVGRREVKADDIAHLVDEQWIGRQLEALAAVRLQAERPPHTADRRMRKAGFSRHRTDRPVRRVRRRGAQRSLDHSGNLVVVDGSRSAGASLVEQTITAIL
jgi:hypothetical protein